MYPLCAIKFHVHGSELTFCPACGDHPSRRAISPFDQHLVHLLDVRERLVQWPTWQRIGESRIRDLMINRHLVTAVEWQIARVSSQVFSLWRLSASEVTCLAFCSTDSRRIGLLKWLDMCTHISTERHFKSQADCSAVSFRLGKGRVLCWLHYASNCKQRPTQRSEEFIILFILIWTNITSLFFCPCFYLYI